MGALDTVINCNNAAGLSSAQSLFPIASDSCDTDVSNIVKVSGAFVPDPNCPQGGTYTNTWTVTDDCNNTSAVFTQTITLQDTMAPTLTTPASGTTPISCTDTPSFTAPVFADACGTVTTTFVDVDVPDPNCPNGYTRTRTYTGTDAYGNTITSAFSIVVEDNDCLLYTSPSPRDKRQSRMPSSA